MEAFFRQAGIEIRLAGQHHHARPGWIQLDCPFCGKDSHRFHLGYNLLFHYFACWRCGGLPTRRVWEALGLRWDQVREWMEEHQVAPPPPTPRAEGVLREPSHRGPLLPAHRNYLIKRGLDPDEIVRIWQIEGIGIAPRLSWRIYIPIFFRGERVSWTTRAIGDVAQRYLSASAEEEKIPHKKIVYGLDFCYSSVVVVEGPFDVWKIGPGAGALFGIQYSLAQVRCLAAIPFRTICFDNEPVAQERARELCRYLSTFPGRTQNIVLDAKDPGSASPREIRLIRRSSGLES